MLTVRTISTGNDWSHQHPGLAFAHQTLRQVARVSVLCLLLSSFDSICYASTETTAERFSKGRSERLPSEEALETAAGSPQPVQPSPEYPEFIPFKVRRIEGQTCRTESDCLGKGFCQIAAEQITGICIIEETFMDPENGS